MNRPFSPAQTPSTLIKVCGLTREADVIAVRDAQVSFAGFVLFAGSQRHLSIERARMLVELLASAVTPVLVLVDADDTDVRAIHDYFTATDVRYIVQFHGRESAERCRLVSERLQRPYWRAMPVAAGAERLNAEAATRALVDFALPFKTACGLLLDSQLVSAHDGASSFGGTGHAFDWNKIQWSHLQQSVASPLVLSGGLNAANVGDGIRIARPWAVDVSSGVEMRSPNGELHKGIKDPEAIFEFAAAVRQADARRSPTFKSSHASPSIDIPPPAS